MRCDLLKHREPGLERSVARTAETTRMLSVEKTQSLRHKLLVILENAPVSSVVIEYELGIRKAVRKINRVAAGHHLVLITIRHQHRVMNA